MQIYFLDGNMVSGQYKWLHSTLKQNIRLASTLAYRVLHNIKQMKSAQTGMRLCVRQLIKHVLSICNT